MLERAGDLAERLEGDAGVERRRSGMRGVTFKRRKTQWYSPRALRPSDRSVANPNRPRPPQILSVARVLAVVRVGERRTLAFVTPDLSPGSLGVLQEVVIPIFKVAVDCRLRGI